MDENDFKAPKESPEWTFQEIMRLLGEIDVLPDTHKIVGEDCIEVSPRMHMNTLKQQLPFDLKQLLAHIGPVKKPSSPQEFYASKDNSFRSYFSLSSLMWGCFAIGQHVSPAEFQKVMMEREIKTKHQQKAAMGRVAQVRDESADWETLILRFAKEIREREPWLATSKLAKRMCSDDGGVPEEWVARWEKEPAPVPVRCYKTTVTRLKKFEIDKELCLADQHDRPKKFSRKVEISRAR
jgi:hypothetical protein